MASGTVEKIVHVSADSVKLEGALCIPGSSKGVVLFAHGSGSSRHSPRNNFVAQVFRGQGLATLLIDLLTQSEDTSYRVRFDIPLLTGRLIAATRWLKQEPETRNLAVGYFGASTGAAAALQAAAGGPSVRAIVSRGGRPDLAMPVLKDIQVPTLFIVGGLDTAVIELNRKAYDQISGEKELVIVPGASHLFEESGALEKVADLAAQWFRRHLG